MIQKEVKEIHTVKCNGCSVQFDIKLPMGKCGSNCFSEHTYIYNKKNDEAIEKIILDKDWVIVKTKEKEKHYCEKCSRKNKG